MNTPGSPTSSLQAPSDDSDQRMTRHPPSMGMSSVSARAPSQTKIEQMYCLQIPAIKCQFHFLFSPYKWGIDEPLEPTGQLRPLSVRVRRWAEALCLWFRQLISPDVLLWLQHTVHPRLCFHEMPNIKAVHFLYSPNYSFHLSWMIDWHQLQVNYLY